MYSFLINQCKRSYQFFLITLVASFHMSAFCASSVSKQEIGCIYYQGDSTPNSFLFFNKVDFFKFGEPLSKIFEKEKNPKSLSFYVKKRSSKEAEAPLEIWEIPKFTEEGSDEEKDIQWGEKTGDGKSFDGMKMSEDEGCALVDIAMRMAYHDEEFWNEKVNSSDLANPNSILRALEENVNFRESGVEAFRDAWYSFLGKSDTQKNLEKVNNDNGSGNQRGSDRDGANGKPEKNTQKTNLVISGFCVFAVSAVLIYLLVVKNKKMDDSESINESEEKRRSS